MAAKSMGAFEILAAIDLRAGRVVRLRKGDFEHETAYSDDPVATAVELVRQGTHWLHVVDLDGARAGGRRQRDLMSKMVATVGARSAVEVAGGFRNGRDVGEALAAGAARVVVGTAALAEPGFATTLVRRHGADRIVVALDVRGGKAVGEGWRTGSSGVSVNTAITQLIGAGVGWCEATAIDRDGTLDGPDLGLLSSALASASGASVIASGGIRSVGDLRAVHAVGCVGAIVGRALYEGTLTVGDALTVGDELSRS